MTLQNMTKGAVSVEYALLAGVLTASIGFSFLVFSEDMQTSVCRISERALEVTGGPSDALDCGSMFTSVEPSPIPEAPATDPSDEEPEPSEITRYGDESSSRFIVGWTGEEGGDDTFPDDKPLSETFYAKFVDIGIYDGRCALPESDDYCLTSITGMPPSDGPTSQPIKMSFDASDTKLMLNGLNHQNLDISVKNVKDHAWLDVAGGAAEVPARVRVNGFGEKIYVQPRAEVNLSVANGNFFASNPRIDIGLIVENQQVTEDTVLHSFVYPSGAGAQILTRHPYNKDVTFICRHKDHIEDGTSIASIGDPKNIGFTVYDEIEAVSASGPSTVFKFYHKNAGSSEFSGIDENCNPYSTQYDFLRYFSELPEDSSVTRYSGLNDAVMDWLAEGDASTGIPGDAPMKQTRSIKFVFDAQTREYHNVDEACKTGELGTECMTTFRNLPRAEIDTQRFQLILDSGNTDRKYRGFPTGPWDLQMLDHADRYSVIQPMSMVDTRSDAHTDFSVDADGGVVWLNTISDGGNLHYTLKNGTFMVGADRKGQSAFTPVNISVIPAAVEQDTIARIWAGRADDALIKIKKDDPAAKKYDFFCRSAVPSEPDYASVKGIKQSELDSANASTRRAYDEIVGRSGTGGNLMYRIYLGDPTNLSFTEAATPCDLSHQYFN